jgi:hypothetical protein
VGGVLVEPSRQLGGLVLLTRNDTVEGLIGSEAHLIVGKMYSHACMHHKVTEIK